MKALATYVDRLIERSGVTVSESALPAVSVHGLDEGSARALVLLLSDAGISARIVDSADQVIEELDDGIAPFRVNFVKPEIDGVGFVSTHAFREWMAKPESVGLVRVACCTEQFRTEGFVVAPWGVECVPHMAEGRGSPALVVRVLGGNLSIAADIRPFVLASETAPWRDQAFIAWLKPAVTGLLRSLSTEVDASQKSLEFVGPPRLRLAWPEDADWIHLEQTAFFGLQSAAAWVYTLPREVELRFRLFTQEFVRLAPSDVKAFEALKVVGLALEGARIAYNFNLQDVSKDALKSFAELRKGVADDIQKLVESTKQLALSGAAALFYGVGLLATRLTSAAVPVWVVDSLAAIGLAYVAVILFINFTFLRQQQTLRPIWKRKLYRYLTSVEYAEMVEAPTTKCERQLNWTMSIVLLLSLGIFAGVGVVNHMHVPSAAVGNAAKKTGSGWTAPHSTDR